MKKSLKRENAEYFSIIISFQVKLTKLTKF